MPTSSPPSSSSSSSRLVPSSVSAAAGDVTVLSHPSKFCLQPRGRGGRRNPRRSPWHRPLTCDRPRFRGLSRLRSPSKYAHALKVHISVAHGDALFRLQTMELCFHKNASIRLGMCPAAQLEKLSKNSWPRSISPCEGRILTRGGVDPRRVSVKSGHFSRLGSGYDDDGSHFQ